jgi:Ca2+/Na+ antiporter
VVDVRIIGGGLPALPGTASSFEVASVPEASVSMSASLRGRKKFRVTTSLGGMFNEATFCSALALSLKFRQFRRWRAACASVLLGNNPPSLFVALLFLVC